MMKEKNFGIELLRVWMCFEVFVIHVLDRNQAEGPVWEFFLRYTPAAVPSFMFLAFYLSSKKLLRGERVWLKRRMRRLLIPYIGWPLVYSAVCFVLNRLIRPGEDVSLRMLLVQWLTGHEIMTAFWFLLDLMILTLLFWVCFKCCSRFWVVCAIWFVFAVSAQYLGWNVLWFGGLPFELRYPLGRLLEMIPYACLGIVCAEYRLPQRLTRTNPLFQWGLIFLTAFSSWYFAYSARIPAPLGFDYQGGGLMLLTLSLFFCFVLLPKKMFLKGVRRLVELFGKLSLGMYAIRGPLTLVLRNYIYPWIGFSPVSTLNIFIVWFLAFCMTWILTQIPCRLVNALAA